MSTPTYITIGIPFYNAEKYLEDAICSILAQTHIHWELLLIDDGSSDQSLDIAKSYEKKDSRIRVLSDGENKKLPFRLNQIIDESKYNYIARMDADDLISSTRLQKQVYYLLNNDDIDLVSTGILSLKNDLTLVGYRNTPTEKLINQADAVIGTTGIIHASIMARKSWYRRNRYNEANLLAEDYELWLNAFLRDDLKVGFIEEPLYYYREEQSITLKKILKAYNTQIGVINSFSREFISSFDKLKYTSKVKFKMTIAKSLFFLNLDGLLHKRRVQTKNIDELRSILTYELKLINDEMQI